MSEGEITRTVRPTGDQGGDPQTSTTLVAAMVGAILVFAAIVALQAFFYRSEETERTTKVYGVVPEELAKLRATQEEQLNAYRWVDRERRLVTIPISRAMELTVGDQGRNPPTEAAPAKPKSREP
jgi:hypothetical protein